MELKGGVKKMIGRIGSKDNDLKYFEHLLPTNINRIVEPFGGSYAVTRLFYENYDIEKIINDNDDVLYETYTNPKEFIRLLKVWNKIYDKCFIEEKNYSDGKCILKKWKKTKGNEKIKYHIYLTLKSSGHVKKKIFTKKEEKEYLESLTKIDFKNDDYKKLLKKYQKNKNTFIFLDPPYINSYNEDYKNLKENPMLIIEYIYIYINDPKTKAKVMLIINETPQIKKLFKNQIKDKYEKIYQLKKKRENLLIITNY